MKRALIKAILISGFLSSMFAFGVYSATINSVSFRTYLEEDNIQEDTVTDPRFAVTDSTSNGYLYVLSDEDLLSSEDTSYRSLRSYELTFIAVGNNRFNTDSTAISVRGEGVDTITSRRATDSGRTLIVRVRAYPYAKLPETEPDSLPDDGDSRLQLSKGEGVSTVEYYLTYEDADGDLHTVHNSITANYVNVSSYTRNGRSVVGFYCRSRRASNTSNPNLVPSDWDGDGIRPINADLVNYHYWSDYLGDTWERGNVITSGGSSSSKSNDTGGWIIQGDSWYFLRSNGDVATGWVDDDGRWYYLDPQTAGRMVTGWADIDGRRYYFNPNDGGPLGSMMTGWISQGGNWYYLSPNSGDTLGSLMTGWIEVGGKWYYLEPGSGRMLTGWISESGYSYYLNPNDGGPLGSMVTGWFSDGEYWYYLNPVSGGPLGSLQSGWIHDGNYWYYCDPSNSGRLKTGWFIDTDGQMYYLNPVSGGPLGSMVTGWQTIDGASYYFRVYTDQNGGSQGAALINTSINIGGATYYFGANGALLAG